MSVASVKHGRGSPAVLADDHDPRRATRKPEHAPGLIKVRGYRISLPCCIQDTSATGACVILKGGGAVEDASHLPERLVIAFVSEMVEIDCQVVWRDGGRFGVRFTSSFRRTEG